MPYNIKKRIVTQTSHGELVYYPLESLHQPDISGEYFPILKNVLQVISKYRTDQLKLINGKYKEISNILPNHFTNKCLITVTCCPDGIAIRYDKNKSEIVAACWFSGSIKVITPVLSENYVYLMDKGEIFDSKTSGIKLTFRKANKYGKSEILAEEKVALIVDLSKVEKVKHTMIPDRLVDATDIMDIELCGKLLYDHEDSTKMLDEGKPFVARTPFHIGVKWQAFQVYSKYLGSTWSQSMVSQWAENDILLSATIYNMSREKYLSLDPYFKARQNFFKLLNEFDSVLKTATKEEDLQQFFNLNPSFIEPSYKRVWPKLRFGRVVTDFVFESATGEYLLVELEHPQKKLFTKSIVQSAELTQAIDQILEWRRYIEDNLSTVRNELELKRITPNPKSLIVIGRDKNLTKEMRRKLATLEGQCPNLKILTYDDLKLRTLSTFENMVGPISQQANNVEIYYPVTK